jgi:hypothetical protein
VIQDVIHAIIYIDSLLSSRSWQLLVCCITMSRSL